MHNSRHLIQSGKLQEPSKESLMARAGWFREASEFPSSRETIGTSDLEANNYSLYIK